MSVAVIELAIGMAFVFLLSSLLVSAFTEIVASWARWRSGNLWKGLRGMLGSDVQQQLYAHPLIKTMVTPTTGPPIGLGWVLAVPGLRRLWPQGKGPSYIPARTFAFALLDLIERPYRTLEMLTTRVDEALADAARLPALAESLEALKDAGPFLAAMTPIVQPFMADLNAGAPERTRAALLTLRAEILRAMKEPGLADADLQDALRPMLRAAGDDIERLRGEVEGWFDGVMDRVSGWYKRKTQAVQFAAGLVLAIALDLDAILVARVLWSDSALRSAVVAEAEMFARNPPPRLAEPAAAAPAAGAPVVRLSSPRVPGGATVDVTVHAEGHPNATATLSSSSPALGVAPAAAAAKGPDAPPPTETAPALPPPSSAPWPLTITLDDKGDGTARLAARGVAEDTVAAFEVTVEGGTTTGMVLVTGDPEAQFERVNQRIASLGLPLRGSCDAAAAAGKPASWWCAAQIRSTKHVTLPYVGTIDVQTDPLRWLGWLLTALAATMGAPFWFDLLKRFVNVRSAVATNEREAGTTKSH